MNGKKVLAILGSPHSGGTTATMLRHAIRAAENAGYTVYKVNLYEKQLKDCIGCRVCLRTRECVQKDDLQEITALLKECHAVILAAPTYWANVPAAVKRLFDRLLGCAMEETATFPKPRLTGRQYMLLTACNTPFPFSWLCGQSRGAIHNMDEFFKTAGMRCMGKVVCANTSKITALPSSLIKRIERCWR